MVYNICVFKFVLLVTVLVKTSTSCRTPIELYFIEVNSFMLYKAPAVLYCSNVCALLHNDSSKTYRSLLVFILFNQHICMLPHSKNNSRWLAYGSLWEIGLFLDWISR